MGFRSGDLRQRLLFQPHVGVDINLCSLYGLMSKPERYYGLVDAVMEQFHRCAMSQGMRRYAFAREARTYLGCREAMLAHQMFKCITAELLAPDRGKQGLLLSRRSPIQP
jgi:hypothetical protein